MLEIYQQKKSDDNKNYLGVDMVLDRLIVMDHVSGLADRSENFANSLTVSRKYGLTYAYIFGRIYLTKQHWKMIFTQTKIFSQTKIFNFFPGSDQASVIIRILLSFASRYKHNYIPHRDLWINRLYFEIYNTTRNNAWR